MEGYRGLDAPNAGKVYGICCRFYVMRKHFPEIITAFVVISALPGNICRVFSPAFVVSFADLGNICRVILPAFVVSLALCGNICRELFRRLWSCCPCLTTFAGILPCVCFSARVTHRITRAVTYAAHCATPPANAVRAKPSHRAFCPMQSQAS